ncbi:MAG TPA: response regulator [Hyphomicrobiaceae bacterium]|nr:response regulator [Hyphomicrobiaceae bacterium]
MANSTRKTGSQFLARKSALAIARQNMTRYRDFLVVEDTPLDADRLKATLHSIFGYEISVRHAATLGSALDRVIEQAPDIVFLDDHLKPSDTAAQTIPLLRRCNYTGHIIVISGMLDRKRAAELRDAGATLSIHKDNLDSGSIAEALATIDEATTAPEKSIDNASSAETAEGSSGSPVAPGANPRQSDDRQPKKRPQRKPKPSTKTRA